MAKKRRNGGPAWRLPLLRRPSAAEFVTEFLRRHPKLPIKATLLLQDGFPGVGNWMADEILWRAHVSPHRLNSKLTKSSIQSLYDEVRFVCRVALEEIGPEFLGSARRMALSRTLEARGYLPETSHAIETRDDSRSHGGVVPALPEVINHCDWRNRKFR